MRPPSSRATPLAPTAAARAQAFADVPAGPGGLLIDDDDDATWQSAAARAKALVSAAQDVGSKAGAEGPGQEAAREAASTRATDPALLQAENLDALTPIKARKPSAAEEPASGGRGAAGGRGRAGSRGRGGKRAGRGKGRKKNSK